MTHRWSEHSRDDHRTLRICSKCELMKVTRHETDERGFPTHWIEFWRGSDKIGTGSPVPKCEAVEAEALSA